jgi:hypothetical protein
VLFLFLPSNRAPQTPFLEPVATASEVTPGLVGQPPQPVGQVRFTAERRNKLPLDLAGVAK